MRDADDTRCVVPEERTEIFDITCENDASLGDGEFIERWVGHTTQMQVLFDMFHVKAFIEERIQPAMEEVFVQKKLVFEGFRHGNRC